MLFRLTNASATLQAVVTKVLYQYLDDFCVVYIDNVIIYSKNKEDYKGHIKKVFDALNKARLKVKLKKSEFRLKEVQFLGHIITAEELQIDPEKIKAVLEQPDLRSADDICKLTRLTNYCQRFIKNYSKIVELITRLLKKDQKFTQGKEQKEAWEKLKEQFLQDLALVLFNLQKLL